MEMLTPIERAILDTTAHEAENLERIYQHLHAPPAAVPLDEAADAILSLVEKGLLAPRPSGNEPLPDAPRRVWKARFEPTPQGRELIGDRGPEPPPGWPEGRVYAGMFRGRAKSVPFEVFKENRREMSRKYAEDTPDA